MVALTQDGRAALHHAVGVGGGCLTVARLILAEVAVDKADNVSRVLSCLVCVSANVLICLLSYVPFCVDLANTCMVLCHRDRSCHRDLYVQLQ